MDDTDDLRAARATRRAVPGAGRVDATTADPDPVVGFVGLGNMGSALAANLVAAGHTVVAHDVAGPDRAVGGAAFVDDLAEVAHRAAVVVLSLPDGAATEQVADRLASTPGRRTTHVVDTSTVGVAAAAAVAARLDEAGVAYVDAPVSGGAAGARARTLTVMYAGTDGACGAVAEVLAGLSDRVVRVGDRPGQGQAMKLANNFVSAAALVATSEAIAFGAAAGLDMGTMLEVLNGSSGRSQASADKFPTHVLTGRFASGFTNTLMAKDLGLYLAAVADVRTAGSLGTVTLERWREFAAASPGADFTRIHPFVAGG